MAVTSDEVLGILKRNEYAPIYFLQGEETFYIDQISNFIEANAIEESQKSFNLMVLYGKDVDMAQILTDARRFPMMSDRQVVIVKEAQEVESFKKEEGRKLLEAYLENPQPSTILVFCHKHKKIDGRSGLSKKLKTHSIFVNSEEHKKGIPKTMRIKKISKEFENVLEKLGKFDKYLEYIERKKEPTLVFVSC